MAADRSDRLSRFFRENDRHTSERVPYRGLPATGKETAFTNHHKPLDLGPCESHPPQRVASGDALIVDSETAGEEEDALRTNQHCDHDDRGWNVDGEPEEGHQRDAGNCKGCLPRMSPRGAGPPLQRRPMPT